MLTPPVPSIVSECLDDNERGDYLPWSSAVAPCVKPLSPSSDVHDVIPAQVIVEAYPISSVKALQLLSN